METFIIIAILSLLSISGLLCLYGIYRCEQVYKFRSRVVELNYDYAIRLIDKGALEHYNSWGFYSKLPSFNDMVFSLKPLKLSSYFTNEELTELFSE